MSEFFAAALAPAFMFVRIAIATVSLLGAINHPRAAVRASAAVAARDINIEKQNQRQRGSRACDEQDVTEVSGENIRGRLNRQINRRLVGGGRQEKLQA